MKLAPFVNLVALLVLGPSAQALAQNTHLGVPVLQLTVVKVNGTPGLPNQPPQFWSEWIGGVVRGGGEIPPQQFSPAFTVATGRTLVITDADASFSCNASAAAAPPRFSVNVLDPSGQLIFILTRLQPARTTGQSEVQKSFTGGIAVPGDYKLVIDNVENGGCVLSRGAFVGYYLNTRGRLTGGGGSTVIP